MIRHCEHCDKPLVRRPTEGAGRFSRRRFCGRDHARGREPIQVNHCRQCKEPMVKRPDERPWSFGKRLFCDRICRGVYDSEHPTTIGCRGAADDNVRYPATDPFPSGYRFDDIERPDRDRDIGRMLLPSRAQHASYTGSSAEVAANQGSLT